jgi:hypothetical protein
MKQSPSEADICPAAQQIPSFMETDGSLQHSQ